MRIYVYLFTSVIGAAGVLTLTAGCRRASPSSVGAQPVPSLAAKGRAAASLRADRGGAGHAGEAHDGTGTAEEHEGGHHHEHFAAAGTLVTDHGIPLFRETQPFKWSPEERARRVAARLNMISTTHGLEAEHVSMRRVKGFPTVFYYHRHGPESEGHILATVDPATARGFGQGGDPDLLAYWWRDVLRDHALIIGGEAPRWTVRYAPPLQELYERLQRERRGVPNHTSFDHALARLPAADMRAMKDLYNSVPANYRPQPDDLRAALATGGHSGHSHPHAQEDDDHDHGHDGGHGETDEHHHAHED